MRAKRSRIKLPHAEYKKLCVQVHERDGWKCKVPYCGKRNNLHCHHITFRSHGGDDASYNLITVCNTCHDALHFKTTPHDQGVIIHPLRDNEQIDADKGVRWQFVNGWLPRKTLRSKHKGTGNT